MSLRAFALSVVAIAATATTAAAQTWGAPEREFAAYGVRTITCDERTHDAPCLGLACVDGSIALVSAAGGGGPMDGSTTVSTGKRRFTLDFTWDDKAVDKLGVAASRAFLTIDQFDALVAATSITLTATSDKSIRHRFSVRGLPAAWAKAAQGCG